MFVVGNRFIVIHNLFLQGLLQIVQVRIFTRIIESFNFAFNFFLDFAMQHLKNSICEFITFRNDVQQVFEVILSMIYIFHV
jgi:hypothetical protein